MAQTLAGVHTHTHTHTHTSIFTKINEIGLNCTIKGVVDFENIFLNKINKYKDSIIQAYYRYV